MARKHKHPEHVNHERWLVSYADFITLLFATFTALYALSKSDADKSKAMAESMRISFGSPANTLIPMSSLDFKAVPSDKPGPSPAGKSGPKREATKADMENVKSQLQTMLMTRKLLEAVNVEVTDRGLVISLKESGFFESGKSEMKWDAYPVLGEIAANLAEYRNPVRVEGHTDTVPMRTRTFPSNWELSSARATEVVRLLSGRFGMDPKRFSAVGYAEFRPAFSNATPSGRARNRRVDLVVLNPEAERAEAPGETVESIPSNLGAEAFSKPGESNAGPGTYEDSDGHPANPDPDPSYHPALDDWSGSP